jgi:hypothetical protein
MKRRLLVCGLLSAVCGLVLWAADELSVTTIVNYTKGSDTELRTVTETVTVNGTARAAGVLNVGTVSTAVDLSNLTTPGYVLLRNLAAEGSTNYVRASSDGTNWLVRANAGEPALFRLASNELYLVASPTNVATEYRVFSD